MASSLLHWIYLDCWTRTCDARGKRVLSGGGAEAARTDGQAARTIPRALHAGLQFGRRNGRTVRGGHGLRCCCHDLLVLLLLLPLFVILFVIFLWCAFRKKRLPLKGLELSWGRWEESGDTIDYDRYRLAHQLPCTIKNSRTSSTLRVCFLGFSQPTLLVYVRK